MKNDRRKTIPKWVKEKRRMERFKKAKAKAEKAKLHAALKAYHS